MSPEALKKLRYKQGQALMLNAPEGFQLGIGTQDSLNEKYDFALLFAKNAAEVEEWVPKVIPALNEDAVFWISYPKQSSKIKSDINRDVIWKMIDANTDYTLVSNVAIDETWSALRVRRKDKVKK